MISAPSTLSDSLWWRHRQQLGQRLRHRWLGALAMLVGALVALPVLAVVSQVLAPGTSDTWTHLASTVLPDYAQRLARFLQERGSELSRRIAARQAAAA